MIVTANYANVKIIADQFCKREVTMMYQDYTGDSGSFYMFLFIGKNMCVTDTEETKPMTFDADFPNAVALDTSGSAISPTG